MVLVPGGKEIVLFLVVNLGIVYTCCFIEIALKHEVPV